MLVTNVNLEAVAVRPQQYPEDRKPEIAFVGRSNVGKSSLINTMINRKSLARTSQNPGKTRTINFYNIENLLYFVDLPGYGYAKAPKSEKEKWGKMIESYLLKREQLRNIVMLIDIRHEPQPNDKTMYNWLKFYNYEIILVATKVDKLKRSQVNKHISMLKKFLELDKSDIIIPFSSKDNVGNKELWDILKNNIIENTEESIFYTKFNGHNTNI